MGTPELLVTRILEIQEFAEARVAEDPGLSGISPAELLAMTNQLSNLIDQNASLQRDIRVLEKLRPHWAKGYSSDSMAAQAAIAALSDIWGILNVSNQTEAMETLRKLIAIRDESERSPSAVSS